MNKLFSVRRFIRVLLSLLWVLGRSEVIVAAAAQAPTLRNGDGWYLSTADKACRLYVYEVGTGTPVVVVHGGFGAEYSYMEHAVDGLTSQFHFIFYDQRGSLRSPCKLENVSFKGHVQDLETLRQALHLPKLNLLAHSKGTMLVAEYMKEYPENVGKVVLAGALPMKAGSFLGSKYSKLVGMDAAAALMVNRPEVKTEINHLLQTEPPGPRRDTHNWHIRFAAANIDHIDRWQAVEGGQVFFAQQAGEKAANELDELLTDNYDFSDSFRVHAKDLTVVSGDHDYADWGNSFFTQFAQEVPIHLVILKDAGHEAWIDDPVEFRSTLIRALGP